METAPVALRATERSQILITLRRNIVSHRIRSSQIVNVVVFFVVCQSQTQSG